MSSLLLLLADAAPADAGNPVVTTITKISQDFGVDVPSLLAQMLSFGIVAYILWRFAFKPVMATLDERQKKISSGLQYAEEMKAKLDAAQQATQAQLREAQQKAQQILAEAQKAAKDFSEKQQQEAVEKSNGMVVKALEAIELEKKKMLAEARTEIARLVVVTTQRVLTRELSEADRARYNESAARELNNVV
jgi:F-type H+-transporting ATPase subunit b